MKIKQRDKSGRVAKTHGKTNTPEFSAWDNMLDRCNNPSHGSYPGYGGRGIKVCDRWQGPNGFANFLADVGNRPTSDHSIDRIDNDKGYEPGNCRWATRKEQQRNRRGNNRLTHDGCTLTVAEWIEQSGIKGKTFRSRLHLGWTIAEILSTPIRPKKLDGIGERYARDSVGRRNRKSSRGSNEGNQ